MSHETSPQSSAVSEIKDHVAAAETAVDQAAQHPTIQMLGRVGYATNGIVYVLIGVFAVLAALGQRGGENTGRMGILQNIAESRFGLIGLLVLGAGFLGFGVWQGVRAIADVDNKGRELKGLAMRFGYLIIGFWYLLAGASVGAFLLNARQQMDSDSTDTMIARVMRQSWGGIAVGAVGLVIVAIAGFQWFQAWRASFQKYLDLEAIPADRRDVFINFGRFGYAARGVVFGIIAFFVVQAALVNRSQDIKGFDGALNLIASQSYGRLMLGVVAAGLIAFGIYALIESRYRRFYPTST